jgi:GTP-dependent phosphoenolpyruvate carboxykinase
VKVEALDTTDSAEGWRCLKKLEFYDEKLFAAIKLILSGYIHWNGSVEKIISYIANLSKGNISKISSKKAANPDADKSAKICIKCRRVHYLNDEKCDYCNGFACVLV